MIDPRKIKRLIDWLVKQRAQHLDMVTDAGDASLWCKEEADLISEYIRTVEALATRPKAHEVTPRPAWDDETCLRFAEAYDREDAAQRGEPSPHADKGEGYAEWAAERVSCVRAGLALVPAPAVPDNVAAMIRRARATPLYEGSGDESSLAEELADALARMQAMIGKGPTHRHIKRGTLYRHLGTARIQSDEPLADYAEVEIYHGAQGDLWARRKVEFHDGRFAALTHPTGGSND